MFVEKFSFHPTDYSPIPEGVLGSIFVSISEYTPEGVACLDPVDGAPPEASCAEALEFIPSDKRWTIFGPHRYPFSEIEIPMGVADSEFVPPLLCTRVEFLECIVVVNGRTANADTH